MTLDRFLRRRGMEPEDIEFNIERLKDVTEFHGALKELLDKHEQDLGDDFAKDIMLNFKRQNALANIDELIDEHTLTPQQYGAKKAAEARKRLAASKAAKKLAPKPTVAKTAAAAKGKTKISAA